MIRLYLLGYKGYRVLVSLSKEQLKLVELVIIGRDKNVNHDYSVDIEIFCIRKSVPFQYRNKKEPERDIYGLAIGWKWIISNLNKLIIIHDSILPKLRGFNPLVTALIMGEKFIGATAIFAKEGYDEGDIIIQKTHIISYPIKINNAIEIIAELYVEIVNEIFNSMLLGQTIKSNQQNSSKATYSLWRDQSDYFINWNDDAKVIERFVDSVGPPYEGAKCNLDGEVLTVYDAKAMDDDANIINRDTGKVIFKKEGCFHIVCGKGLIAISTFFNDNKEPLDFSNKFRLRFS